MKILNKIFELFSNKIFELFRISKYEMHYTNYETLNSQNTRNGIHSNDNEIFPKILKSCAIKVHTKIPSLVAGKILTKRTELVDRYTESQSTVNQRFSDFN